MVATSGRLGHGSLVVDRNWALYVELGLPAPQGFIPVLPKYVPCNRGPWGRPGGKYCRLIESYGPEGVSKALAKASISLRWDPLYHTNMPYLTNNDIVYYVSPREALERLIYKGSTLSHKLLSFLDELRSYGIPTSDIGITGSYGLTIAQEFSDIDLVIYGDSSLRAMKFFVDRATAVECKDDFGGLKVIGTPCLAWRRGLVKAEHQGVVASWVGVPNYVAGHCPRLHEGIEGPPLRFNATIDVPGGELSALLYPPCVRLSDGSYLLSFEYNLAYIMYVGGKFEIEGLRYGDLILLGSRELPGSLKVRQLQQDQRF